MKRLSIAATASKLIEDGVLADADYLDNFLREFRGAIAKEIQERIRNESGTVYESGGDFSFSNAVGFDTSDVEDILEEYQK